MFLPDRDTAGITTADFSAEESQLLRTLASQVGELIAQRAPGTSDPAIARLLPSAYPQDPEADAEFRRFTEGDLASRKVENAGIVVSSLEGGTVRLDQAQAAAWLRTLTDIRLTLAARLGIEADDEPGDESTPEALMMRDVYDWLGYLQESLVLAVDA